MKLHSLYIHPIKSCAANKTRTSIAEPRGLQGDRRAMLVTPDGQFLTQRTHPKMALIKTRFDDGQLGLNLGGHEHRVEWSKNRQDVTVWNDDVDALVATDATNSALSEFLGKAVRLVSMDDLSARRSKPGWGEGDVSFADGFPVLIANTASLTALSAQAGIHLDMRQFRPNIVLETDTPWIEDSWGCIQIGEVVFDLVRPCTRCVVTTLDPDTGETTRSETMAAMMRARKSGDKRIKGVLFGVNAIPRNEGRVSVGDVASVLETREPWALA